MSPPGCWEAGGVPLDMPVVSLGETQVRPTAMLWRNMAAMAIEEMIRANPINGVVLLGGCDKTIPALLMGAASVDLPAVVVPGGPMLTGTFRGMPLGCGTDVWRLSEDVRAGKLSQEEFLQSESSMIRSRGHCNTMGTASTMGLLAEALGTTLPGTASLRPRTAGCWRRRTRPVRWRLRWLGTAGAPARCCRPRRSATPSWPWPRSAARRTLSCTCWPSRDAWGYRLAWTISTGSGRRCRCWSTCSPPGQHLMEDFHRAGGLLAVLREVEDLLDPAALTVTGRPLVHYLAGARIWDHDVIRGRQDPLQDAAGIAVLRGNLAPGGAIIKPAAASPHLLQHRGRAVVFDSIEDLHARLDDPELEVDADSVLVLRGCGPRGYPGMPEVSNMPLPPSCSGKASATWCGSATAG